MLTHNESMAKHCSLRAGGLAQDFFVPEDLESLSEFLSSNTKPILMLGLGSNLLVRDTGFNGVVIKLKHLNALTIKKGIIHAGAGTTLAKLARFCDANNLNGGAFLSAIPGTVGGALAMNAGAFGSEFWQFVQSVTTINTAGKSFKRTIADFKIGYRNVQAKHPNEYFIRTVLNFNQARLGKNIQQLLAARNKTQPIGLPSCGSVFKNPANYFAAKLIEGSNLKGYCIGNACVSQKHANFIINQNNASAAEIETLIVHIQKTVKSNFNITLETEVKIL